MPSSTLVGLSPCWAQPLLGSALAGLIPSAIHAFHAFAIHAFRKSMHSPSMPSACPINPCCPCWAQPLLGSALAELPRHA